MARRRLRSNHSIPLFPSTPSARLRRRPHRQCRITWIGRTCRGHPHPRRVLLVSFHWRRSLPRSHSGGRHAALRRRHSSHSPGALRFLPRCQQERWRPALRHPRVPRSGREIRPVLQAGRRPWQPADQARPPAARSQTTHASYGETAVDRRRADVAGVVDRCWGAVRYSRFRTRSASPDPRATSHAARLDS